MRDNNSGARCVGSIYYLLPRIRATGRGLRGRALRTEYADKKQVDNHHYLNRKRTRLHEMNSVY